MASVYYLGSMTIHCVTVQWTLPGDEPVCEDTGAPRVPCSRQVGNISDTLVTHWWVIFRAPQAGFCVAYSGGLRVGFAHPTCDAIILNAYHTPVKLDIIEQL